MNSEVSLALKGLPWLKRLQGSLEEDDSSDSSPQLTPKKVRKKQEKVEGTDVRKETRLRRDDDDNGDVTPSGQSDALRERKKIRLKKAVRVRSKRPAEERRLDRMRVKSPAAAAKVKAAARRRQRMQKLHALRVSTGELERIVSFKNKRQQMTLALKDKGRDRMRAVRAARRVSVGAEAEVEDKAEHRRQPLLRQEEDKNHGERAGTIISRTLIQDEYKQTVPSLPAAEKGLDSARDNADESKVKPCAIATCSASDHKKNNDNNMKELAMSVTVSSPTGEIKGHLPFAAITVTTSGHAKPAINKAECFAAIREEPSELEVAEVNVKVEYDVVECGSRESMSQRKSKVATAAKTKMTILASCGVGEHVKTEPLYDSKVTVELMNVPIKAEKQMELPVLDAQSMTNDDEKELVNEVLLNDAMPIPRKLSKAGDLGVPSSAISFVIPKRGHGKTDTVRKTNAQVERAETAEASANGDDKCSIIAHASHKSSSNVTKAESTRLQRKRTKNIVPVRKASFSTQDRALMRLSRKRNSIFMASTELAAQGSDVTGTKVGPVTRMMGYEVFSVDGSTLPDLIPRMCCATKHEMASDQQSYTSSFFGVSRMAPKAKWSCENVDCIPRKINCYEEICFERPEDREFYQQKLYGTAFVPQNLRGWVTLIARNAHFERKSTGIRFNQDRDRESFAAALSQRYTLNKSIPRCDIPRDSWQKLMKNELGTVFLHYYNREDAERASRVFCDDLGQPLQIRRELKAGARIQIGSSPINESKSQRTPRRSTSSERNAPEPSSPQSSQSGNTRNSSLRRQDCSSSARSDRLYSRYDRDKRSRALLERRSRSRLRDRPFYRQNYEASAHETRDNAAIYAYGDVDMPAQKRPRLLNHRSLNKDSVRSKCEDGEEGGLEGEAYRRGKNTVKSEPRDRVGSSDEVDIDCALQRLRSPSRRWEKVPNSARPRERWGHYSDNVRHSKGSTFAQHFCRQQQYSRDSSKAPSRSRSRPRISLPSREGHNGNHDDRFIGQSRQSFRRAESPRERRPNDNVNSRAI